MDESNKREVEKERKGNDVPGTWPIGAGSVAPSISHWVLPYYLPFISCDVESIHICQVVCIQTLLKFPRE